jgi:fructokinase
MSGGDKVIAVAGEALVDLVLEPGGRATSHLGGGPFNAARTLGRLGLRPLFIGRLGCDAHGRALRDELRASGVRLDGIVTTDDPTTFARVDVDGAGDARYRFYIDGTSAPGLLPHEAHAAMRADAVALYVGGLGLVFEPQARAIASLVREAGDRTLVLLDPNCRPRAIRDPRAYRARLREVMRRCDVVKASEADLTYLAPGRVPLDTARSLLELGPSVVLVTHGRDGATVLTASGLAAVRPTRTDVIDTIGAGDAFGAAWLAAWLSDGLGRAELGNLEAATHAAQFASTVAALTCKRAGAEPPSAAKVGPEWCFATSLPNVSGTED